MRITQRTCRDAIVIEMVGDFIYESRKEFTSAIDTVKQSSARHVMLDFSKVTFVDSAAIGLLALAAQQFKTPNRKLSLVSPQGSVKQILELSNISKVLSVFPSEAAATSGKAA